MRQCATNVTSSTTSRTGNWHSICSVARADLQSSIDISEAMKCVQALHGHAVGHMPLENGSLLVPSKRNRKAGFYLFTQNTAHFVAFPDEPSERDGANQFHYFEIELPKTRKLYLTYSISPPTLSPGLATGSAPPQTDKKIFPFKGNEALDSDAKTALRQEVLRRIGTVSNKFNVDEQRARTSVKRGVSQKYPVASSATGPSSYERVTNRLSSCKSIEDPIIKAAVDSELNKINTTYLAPSGTAEAIRPAGGEGVQ